MFLEFAMIMPLFLFLVLFSIDMGRMVLISGALSDVAYVSARSGAQLGGAGSEVNGPSRLAFENAIGMLPGEERDDVTFRVVSGQCTDSTAYVTIEVSQTVQFITPGLSSLLNMWDPTSSADTTRGWELGATGSVLCEIVR